MTAMTKASPPAGHASLNSLSPASLPSFLQGIPQMCRYTTLRMMPLPLTANVMFGKQEIFEPKSEEKGPYSQPHCTLNWVMHILMQVCIINQGIECDLMLESPFLEWVQHSTWCWPDWALLLVSQPLICESCLQNIATWHGIVGKYGLRPTTNSLSFKELMQLTVSRWQDSLFGDLAKNVTLLQVFIRHHKPRFPTVLPCVPPHTDILPFYAMTVKPFQQNTQPVTSFLHLAQPQIAMHSQW